MMTEQQIQDLLSEALVSLFEIDPKKITPETNLYEDLEIDSIDAIDLIDYIKRNTGYKVKPEDFRNVRTVNDVVQAVLKMSQEAQQATDDSQNA
ncbi:Acyl carrier protein [uncultured Avibacterium sp.]|uniref:Acyl carrier protein n=3 Tax=Pasteurellaceae TaxID=712 RepID=A0A447SNG6_AVIVO|nr:Acyl carrier protein [Avibacterium volantium]VGM95872.1 Acyl carrier protein [uncultured Avibacterium sp.]